MTAGVRNLSLAIAFLLELAALFAAGYWGFTLPAPSLVKVISGLGAPVVMAVLWGLFASPKAGWPLTGAAGVIFQISWFAVGWLALALAGRPGPAIALGAIYLLNSAVLLLSKP